MNLQPIMSATTKPFRCACFRCGAFIQTDRDPEARADLDGPPFRAYYCGACVHVLGWAQP